jgi:hypothetical protein
MKTDDEVRAQIKRMIEDGTLDDRVMAVERALKMAPAGSQGYAQDGQSCACWKGQLCRYHNLMYHGEP